ncbi:MAG: COX15/CtaA family protein [Magnetococcales bacterium]|nr:COX15/CtaA family protein [Magnetococcales bacterium]
MDNFSATSAEGRSVARWLFLCCALIVAMVVVGGLTRLTGSGLSMVQWAPVLGWIPPLQEADWQEQFRYYRQSPEFMKINWDMTLEGFKSIFWLEYIHRLLARVTGLVFLLPFLYFWLRRRINQSLAWQFALMFFLGGLQGVVGWYMVASGLVEDPHVSPYRLTAHLGLAVALYAYMLWVALGLHFGQRAGGSQGHPLLKSAVALSGLIYFTLLSGGFVAGLDAGMAYNTFPLMNDEWIPDGIWRLEPFHRNFFENVATVQWDHRLLATLVFVAVLRFWWVVRRHLVSRTIRLTAHLLLGMVLLQLTLGISTLLWLVPTPLASAHQTGAVLLFTLSLFTTHRLRHAAAAC